MVNRRYGRRIPPALPEHRMLRSAARLALPVVDLRKDCGPVKDQGAEGSCTAHAGTSACEWIARKYLNQQPVFSPAYVYAKELIADGDFPQDNGSNGTTLCEVMIANGLCELFAAPYMPGSIVQPTADQDANAAAHKIVGAYHGLAGSQVALSVVGDPEPWVVKVGFTVYESFESSGVASSGVYDPNASTESVLGGHEVLMVGYDVGTNPTIRPQGSQPSALIQNSWGSGWGIGGFFWMALSVLDDPQTDLKVAHYGSPWK